MKKIRRCAAALAVAAVMLGTQTFVYAEPEQEAAPQIEQEAALPPWIYSADPGENAAITDIFKDYAAEYTEGTSAYAEHIDELGAALAEFGLGVSVEFYGPGSEMAEDAAENLGASCDDFLDAVEAEMNRCAEFGEDNEIFDAVMAQFAAAKAASTHTHDWVVASVTTVHIWSTSGTTDIGGGFCKQIKTSVYGRCGSCGYEHIDISYYPGCGSYHGI